jgi:hypothetical protein
LPRLRFAAAKQSPLSSLSTGTLRFRESNPLSILALRGQERPPGNGRKLLSAATADAAEVLRDRCRRSSGGAAGKEARGGGATQVRTHFSRSPAEPELSGEGTAKGPIGVRFDRTRNRETGWSLLQRAPDWEPTGVARPRPEPEAGPVATPAPFSFLGDMPRASPHPLDLRVDPEPRRSAPPSC